MSDNKLDNFYIPHLAGQFRQATPVLFTGAGFSVAAKNIEGNAVPGVKTLCREIWSISFPTLEYEEESTLKDLYEDACIRHPDKLKDRLTSLFTVEPKDLPKFYSDILSMPWSRFYTLNIDNLEEVVSRAFELPRRPASISATSSPGLMEWAAAPDSLDVIHLNGTVADLPNDVTFSTVQYAERIAHNDPWYMRLVADLISRPVVFIGTNLDEPSLWQHLVLRQQRGGRGERELRPRSYLVTPQLSRSRRALLAQFNSVWLPMTAEQFADQVIGRLRGAAKEGLSELLTGSGARRQGFPELPIVSALAANPLRKTDYLIGQEPDWSDVQSGRAIEREHDIEIESVLEKQLSNDGIRGLIVITGTAGSGKSTSLMRTALRLATSGRKVAWIDRDTDFRSRQLVKAVRGDAELEVLAIDDADLYGGELSSMVRELAVEDSRPLILLEMRSGRVDRMIIPAQLEGIPISRVTMRHLTNRDIGALLNILDRENRLGILKGKPKNEQEAAFAKQAGRQLLVAMYEATSGQKFEDKVQEEFFQLESEEQFVYGLISVATAHRYGLSRDEVVIATGDHSNASLNILERLVRNQLIVMSRNKSILHSRHRVIARIVTDELQKRGSLKDILYGLILVSAVKTEPHTQKSARSYRMLRTFLNHDLLFRMLGAEQARNLYGSVEQTLNWEPNYWLQRGSLEVEEGDLRLAENFLGQARSLAPEHPFVANEWAYLLFKKAIVTPGSPVAADFIRDATEILMELIESDRGGSVYPYHVVASQGLAWARRGIRNEDERVRYLRGLVAIVQEGVKKMPESIELRQLEEDLRREALSYSVPYHLRQ